ncbi:hypothetical protein D0B54_18130 [Solimonas sp. K1W22B-7]|uniref:hypothetical protein n=1 Tax=Solimonas sp. K1W22B-7 TaxID=2303331 RepID=UPI000E32EBC7|nr:hypothetical protein [Solimonas sp. K1W22B-7]AXQ30478.1 hypothetical protein D0B54_18130 [Solimonas sp. K1W22B-7]
MNIYRYMPVWARSNEGLVLYRCFEVIGHGFTVQSKDFFPLPHEAERAAQLESQFHELLFEQAPEQRFPIEPTVQAAIEAFNAHFSG